MSDFVWTEDQTKAINLRDKNILVSAAAGSGKTTLLTERLKRQVLNDGVSCRNLLVLTFTRAAASEMKQRFKKKLFDSLATKEIGKLSEKEVLNQINALTDSQISTIHSFAQSMIKRHFEILGIDPGFRIAEDNEIDLLVDETMNEVFEELFLQNEVEPNKETENFIELINLFGGELSNDNLKKSIKALNRFFDTLAYPDEWVKTFTKEIEQVTPENLFELKSLKPLKENIAEALKRIFAKYEIVEKYQSQLPWSKGVKGKPRLEAELDAVDDLKSSKELKYIIEKLKNFPISTITFPVVNAKRKPEEVEAINKCKLSRGNSSFGAYKELRDLKSQFENFEINEEVENLKELSRIFLNLVNLTKKVNEEVDKKKKQLHILYFSDLERNLLKLLENDEVRESIKEEYQYIYLDEVQDTNGVQEAIIELIENGKNRFMVGDIKQSIYRFRSADPGIIIDKYQSYKKDKDSELILLNQNFRSSPEVINGVNSVFEKIMSEELGEIDYNDEAKLIATRKDHTPKPEVDIIVNNHEDYIDKDELQARYIAQKIRFLVENTDTDFKDIGVLYRSINKKVHKILSVFADEGIPVLFEGENQQVDTIEISLFLKLLSLIDNHKQDIPLVSIMELPFFNFSSDDLALIRSNSPDAPYFYLAVEEYRDSKEDELGLKLKDFYEKLDKWRNDSKHLELDEFLWNLLLESGFYSYFGNLANGKERKENLRLLIEKAKNYKESSLKGITAFLQYVAQLKKNGQSLTISGNSADSNNVVRLMSIHKSKGLEFDTVIYADLDKKFNIRNSAPFYLNKEFGFGFELPFFEDEVFTKKDTLVNQSQALLYKKESLSEEIRLLYVAMTRAKDQLFIIANIDNVKDKESTWQEDSDAFDLLNMRYPIDWIMNAIYHASSFEKENEDHFSTQDWEIRIIPSLDVINDTVEEPEIEIEEDENFTKLREQIFRQLSLPEKEVKNNKPLKMSVSRIKKHSIKEEEPVELIPIEKVSEKFTGTDIGTATHMVMQRINLDEVLFSENIVKTIKDEIERIADRGFIDKEIVPLININHILEFLLSGLGKRYLKAYQDDVDNVLKENPFLFDTNRNNELDIGVERPIELSGVIDVSFLEDDGWVIIDYKTDRIYNENQFKQRIDEYSTQINLYSGALEALTDLPVKEKHLYFLSEGKDITV